MKVYQKVWIVDHSKPRPDSKDEENIMRGPVMVAKSDYDALAAELAGYKESHEKYCPSAARLRGLAAALRKAESELGCLLDKHQLAESVITDDMWPEKPNEPDRECMSIAFNAIRAALEVPQLETKGEQG